MTADHERVFPGDARKGEIEVVEEHEVWAGETARLYHDLVRFPAVEGASPEQRQVRLRRGASHDDGVVVAPIREDGRILLVRQFRHAARMWMRELPRGGRKFGESVEDAAARELREEIGHDVLELRHLGRVAPDGAQLETVPHLLAARVRRAGAPEQEETEAIDRIIAVSYDDLYAQCERGDIVDAFTIVACLRLGPVMREWGVSGQK